MRFILLTIVLFYGNILFSQEIKKIDRLWLNAHYGFNHYNEAGAQVQIFKQFIVAGYLQTYSRKLEPGLVKNPKALFWSEVYHKRNRVNSGSLLIGFASPTPNKVFISFLAGPSINHNEIHTNVKIVEKWNGSRYLSSTLTESWKIGLDYKVTLGIRVHDHISLNFGLAGNYNQVENYNRFIFGFGLGHFGWAKPKIADAH